MVFNRPHANRILYTVLRVVLSCFIAVSIMGSVFFPSMENPCGYIGSIASGAILYSLGAIAYVFFAITIVCDVYSLYSARFVSPSLSWISLGLVNGTILGSIISFYLPQLNSVLSPILTTDRIHNNFIGGYPTYFILFINSSGNLKMYLGLSGIIMFYIGLLLIQARCLYNEKESSPTNLSIDNVSSYTTTCSNNSASAEEKYSSYNLTSGITTLADVCHLDATDTDNSDLQYKHHALETTFKQFEIPAMIERVHIGPSLYLFQVKLLAATKLQKVKVLSDNLALAMKSKHVRILTPLSGTNSIGIEVRKDIPSKVSFKKILNSFLSNTNYSLHTYSIPVLVGEDSTGKSIIVDITEMPHLLIAGTTGSGKSMAINALISSVITCCNPCWVKLILIDPKKVELTLYKDSPHLLADVISEVERSASILEWLVEEMDRRYQILQNAQVRHINDYYELLSKNNESIDIMPKIICIIDEFADLMTFDKERVESATTKIARLSRAIGIHLIVATQRPSREILTGAVKANIPARMAFKVSTKINSQIILDDSAAVYLDGKGDMILDVPGQISTTRVQGCFIDTTTINQLIQHSIELYGHKKISSALIEEIKHIEAPTNNTYIQAVNISKEHGYISASLLQRKMKIGYQKAANILQQLIDTNIVSQHKNQNRVHPLHTKSRNE